MGRHDVAPQPEVIDLRAALAHLDGDVGLLREIVEMFLEHVPVELEALARFIAQGDASAVAVSAHSMKGGAANLGAAGFVQAANDLERLAAMGTLEGATEQLDRIRWEHAQLRQLLTDLDWSRAIT
jgi:HPt (histidine-containing phosphotransfer) domain-containing protein